VIWSLLTGRLVREKVDPAVLSAVESQVRVSACHVTSLLRAPSLTRVSVGSLQMSAVEAPVGHGDGADIFETGGSSGMPRADIDALPVQRFAERGNADASGELTVCSVCLQVSATACAC
jgi:hypothetical protein